MKFKLLRLTFLSVLTVLCSLTSRADATIKTVDGTTTTWDLTQITEEMCATLGNAWEKKEDKSYYNSIANSDVSPAFAGGLSFAGAATDKARIYYNGNGYCFNGNAAVITVPVSAGQTLVVTTTGNSIKSVTTGVEFTSTGSGPYTNTATIPDGITSVKIVRISGATYCTRIVTKTESKAAANLKVTSDVALVMPIGAKATITHTTSSNAAVTYKSNNTAVVTVSDAGEIEAIGSGATTVEVAQAETDDYQAGLAQITVAVPYNHTAATEYKISSDDDSFGFADATNNTYYFKNGFSVYNSAKKTYGYGSLKGSIKYSANTEYTINIPEGVTIYSATVTARSNYASTDTGQAAAKLGNLFGEDFSEVTLPYSDQDPINKTVYFAEGKTGTLTFKPTGNQVQFIIVLSASSRTASDLTLTSDATINIPEVGGTSQITWTTSAAATSISFSSSKEGVATVDKNGLITAVSQGTAVITLKQSGDATYRDDSKTITVTVGTARTFTNFSLNFLKDWASATTIDANTTYYVTATDNGVPTTTTEAPASYLATFKGSYHGSSYGLRPGSVVTVPVDGAVKIFVGTSDYGGDFTVTNTANETVATGNAKGNKFSDNPSNVTFVYYNGPATTLTVTNQSGSVGYLPYIAFEAVDAADVPAQYTVTFMNGETLVTTTKVYEGTALGTLPTIETGANQQFVGWYSALDGTGTKATTGTIPTADVTYYAVVCDINITDGYIIVDNKGTVYENGNNLKAAIAYANNNANVNIFLPNGTYHFGQDVLTKITRGFSIIGESRDNVIIMNRPVKEGIGITATLQNSSTGLYLQDLTLDCIAPYGTGDDTKSAERGITLQDKGNKTICKNVYLKGLQDTYYSNNNSGTYYFEDGRIEGTVDYVCGNGDVYFNKVLFYNTTRSQGGGNDVIAAPNTKNSFGYIFNKCTIDGTDVNQNNYRLGRPWAETGTIVRMLDTKMLITPIAEGWSEWGTHTVVQYAEYNSVDANDTPVSLSGRRTQFGSSTNNPVITETEAANYRPEAIFAGSWKPFELAAQLEAPIAEYKDGVITITPADNGAIAYLIEKNGQYVGITATFTYTIGEIGNDDELTIRAANGRGGFGKAQVVSKTGTSIKAINAAIERGEQVIYNLSGQRVNKATRGLYIVNGKKVVIK